MLVVFERQNFSLKVLPNSYCHTVLELLSCIHHQSVEIEYFQITSNRRSIPYDIQVVQKVLERAEKSFYNSSFYGLAASTGVHYRDNGNV